MPGFWESAFGGIMGIMGEGAGDIGRTIGSIVDFPMEAAGNILALPSLPFNAMWLGGREAPLDADLQATWDASIEENPLNQIIRLGEFARYQWERDVKGGRMTGLLSDVGPAANAWDTWTTLLRFGLVLPGQSIERGVIGATGLGGDRVEAAQAMANNITVEDKYANDTFLQMMAERIRNGDYGTVTDPEFHNKMLDDMVINGQVTGNFLGDMALSLVTDPWIVASLGTGVVRKIATSGATAIAAKFYNVLPTAELRLLAQERTVARMVETTGMTEGQAMREFAENLPMRNDALLHVAKQQEFEEFTTDLLDAASGLQRWALVIEPALRPVFRIVDRVNNIPFVMRTGGPAEKAVQTIYNRWSTEGVINGILGVEGFYSLGNRVRGVNPSLWARLENGIGIYTGNLIRLGMRSDLIERAKRDGIDTATLPNDYVTAGVSRLRGKTLAFPMEMLAARFKPLYLALTKGGDKEALDLAREQARTRLVRLGVNEDEAIQMAATLSRDEVAFIDAAYWGHISESFVKAAREAGEQGARLTPIGPHQITDVRAQELLLAIENGDSTFVHQAMQQYALLFENLSPTGMSQTELFTQIKTILKDQMGLDDAGKQVRDSALPKQLAEDFPLPEGLREWQDEVRDLGYLIGEKPPDEMMWRATIVDRDGRKVMIAVNPWIDLSDTASEGIGKVSWTRAARSRAFREVRGQRIMMDARHRLARFGAVKYGINEGDSDALFARVMKAADEQEVAPRGLSGNTMFRLVHSSGIPDEIKNQLSEVEAVEMFLYAFKGDFWHTGLTQRFTGTAKEWLGMRTNWLGVIAESVYPKMRYIYNPVFQLQELAEPFILNTMRGVRPGFTASDMDRQTLDLMDITLHQSRYAADDQIERSAMVLRDISASHETAGPNSRVGRGLWRLMGRGSIRRIKETNYARLQRKMWGDELKESIVRRNPAEWLKMEAAYRTTDAGEIAVRFMSERLNLRMRNPEWTRSLFDQLKPEQIGALVSPHWNLLAQHFDDVTDGAALRAAVRDETISEADFRGNLLEQGADDAFVERAYRQAMLGTPDQFWEAADALAPGASDFRPIYQAIAAHENMTEDDLLAMLFHDVPMGADGTELAALSVRDQSALQLSQRLNRLIPDDHELALREVERMRTVGRTETVEYATVTDKDGVRVYSEFGGRHEVPIPLDRFGLKWLGGNGEAEGGVIAHTHPNTPTSFSGNDLTYGPLAGLAEMRANPHGAGAVLRPSVIGWDTPEWIAAVEAGVIAEWDEIAAGVAARGGRMGLPDIRHFKWGDASTVADIKEGRTIAHLAQRWLSKMLVGTDVTKSPFTDPSGLIGGRFWELAATFNLATTEDFAVFADRLSVVRLAHNLALEDLARRFGWKYEFTWDPSLPFDAKRYRDLLNHSYGHPPDYLVATGDLGTTFTRSIDLPSWDLSYEVAPGDFSMRSRMIGGDFWDNLFDTQKRFITDSTESLTRAMTESLTAVVISDVIRAEGAWVEAGQAFVNPNVVHRVHGTRQQIRVAAALDGLVNQQTEVMASRLRPELDVAGPGQRWSIDLATSGPLRDAEYTDLIEQARQVLPTGGLAPIRYADHSSAVRMIFTDLPEGMTMDEFAEAVGLEDIVTKVDALPGHALGGFLHLEVKANVVDFESVRNNWEEAANGEAYRTLVEGETEGRIRSSVVNRWVQRHNGALHTALLDRLGDTYRAHYGALRARGELPAFRAYADPLEAPSGRHPMVVVPQSLGERPMTLNEQWAFGAQKVDPQALLDADAPAYYRAVDGIQWSKNREPGELNAIRVRNAFMFSVFTPRTMLPYSEVHASRFRAPVDFTYNSGGTIRHISHHEALGQTDRIADQALGRLPVDLQDDVSQLGMAAQVSMGWRFTSDRAAQVPESVANEAGWLDRDGLAEVMREEERIIHETVAREVREGQDPVAALRAVVAESNARINPPQHATLEYQLPSGRVVIIEESQLMAHPWDAARFPDPTISTSFPAFARYVTIASPFITFRTQSMSRNLGFLLTWHRHRFFTAPKFAPFLRQQAWESRDQYLLRVGSVLPGIGGKTSGMAGSALGPAYSNMPPIDVHTTRSIWSSAVEAGDHEELLSRLSPGYGRKLRASADEQAGTGRTEWPTPKPRRVELLLQKMDGPQAIATDRAGTLTLMRKRLQASRLLTDEQKALYTDDVLEVMAQMNGSPSVMVLEGSDYEVMIEFLIRKQAREALDLRARGLVETTRRVEGWSASQYQWSDWMLARGGRLGWMDPHLSLSKDAEHLARLPDMNAGESIDVLSVGTRGRSLDPYAPEATFDPGAVSMNFHRQNGTIMGFNAILEDERRIIGITQSATPETIHHELVHPWERLLHPSNREKVLEAFRQATGSTRQSWNREVSEFWVEHVLRVIASGELDNPALLAPTAHYGKVALERLTRVAKQEARTVAREEKKVLVAAARDAVKAAEAARRPLVKAARDAGRVHERTLLNYQRARARTGVDELAQRRVEAEIALAQAEDAVRATRRAFELERDNLKDLRGRLRVAQPNQRGGLTRAITNSENRMAELKATLDDQREAVTPVREAKVEAVRHHNAATRRKDVGPIEQEFRAAQADLTVADDAVRQADKDVASAQRAVGKAQATPIRPAQAKGAYPEANPVVRDVINDLTKLSKMETRPGSGVAAAMPFDPDQEALYQVARHTLMAAEDKAFTTHYYRRSRSFIERSVNHQYFGLYPASYMWGKVLPEMLRFLLKEPFGIRAPLGGLALANQVHRSMVIQQNFNDEFRQGMVDSTPLWRFMALMTPALPWEIPVNAPLWLRRAAEIDATAQAKEAAGVPPEDIARLTGHALGNITADMAIYAMGPIQSLKYAGDILGLTSDLGNSLFETVSGTLTQAQDDLASEVFQPIQVNPAQNPLTPPTP
jgi:hypothetical protein